MTSKNAFLAIYESATGNLYEIICVYNASESIIKQGEKLLIEEKKRELA